MTEVTDRVVGVLTGQVPVRPRSTTAIRLLGLDAVRLTGGFWAPRQHVNRIAAIPAGREQLERAGNLRNLRIAAGSEESEVERPIFADSDLCKWLEAVAWEYARSPDEELLDRIHQRLGQCRDPGRPPLPMRGGRPAATMDRPTRRRRRPGRSRWCTSEKPGELAIRHSRQRGIRHADTGHSDSLPRVGQPRHWRDASTAATDTSATPRMTPKHKQRLADGLITPLT